MAADSPSGDPHGAAQLTGSAVLESPESTGKIVTGPFVPGEGKSQEMEDLAATITERVRKQLSEEHLKRVGLFAYVFFIVNIIVIAWAMCVLKKDAWHIALPLALGNTVIAFAFVRTAALLFPSSDRDGSSIAGGHLELLKLFTELVKLIKGTP